jgi:tetratricopeptide (TPR) repeat protein
MRKIFRVVAYVASALVLASCYTKNVDTINPNLSIKPSEEHLQERSSPFSPLSSGEYKEEWGKEYHIGRAFALELDFYRALTSYKRALILIPEGKKIRSMEIQYNMVLCYYLAGKHAEAINAFESTDLSAVDEAFPAYRDLLIILHDSYSHTGNIERTKQALELLEEVSAEDANVTALSHALRRGDIRGSLDLTRDSTTYSHIPRLLDDYSHKTLSSSRAKTLNAVMPGAGYWYVGQKRSAVTSFAINALFIAAAYHFFDRGHTAAGIVTTSFEMGWYFGGINGAALAAQEYNERLYESYARKPLTNDNLFPLLRLHYTF